MSPRPPRRWKSTLVGAVLGAAFVFSTIHALDAAPQIRNLEPSETPVPRPLQPLNVDSTWIKDGDPNFFLAWYSQTPKGGSGIWSCDGPTTFEWTFDRDEHVYILEGTVNIEYLGNRFTLKPGQTALFLAGTKAVWQIPDSLKKSFTVHEPNTATRLYRRIIGMT